MQLYANVSTDNIVCQIVTVPDGFTIEDMFVPELLQYMIPCDNTVQVGYIYNPDTQTFTAPPPAPQTWNGAGVRLGLTLPDKTKWDAGATPEIVTVKIEFQSPQERPYTTELLQYLVDSKSISQLSMDRVLAESPNISKTAQQ